MRQYQPIWEQLKKLSPEIAATKGISVTANSKLHPRIIKAVTKEKWLDWGYKIQIQPRCALLKHSRQNSILTFRLILTTNSIGVESV